MTPITFDAAHHTATSELDDLIASWRQHLIAQRMSPATVSTYSTFGARVPMNWITPGRRS
jgi:hypothetical protein